MPWCVCAHTFVNIVGVEEAILTVAGEFEEAYAPHMNGRAAARFALSPKGTGRGI